MRRYECPECRREVEAATPKDLTAAAIEHQRQHAQAAGRAAASLVDRHDAAPPELEA